MPVTTIGATQVHVDAEGFLTDYDEWDEDLGRQLAAAIGIELTEAHWKAIRFLRADYQVQGDTATLRRVSTLAAIPIKELFTLFPGKPSKKMAYIASLPAARLRLKAGTAMTQHRDRTGHRPTSATGRRAVASSPSSAQGQPRHGLRAHPAQRRWARRQRRTCSSPSGAST
jgi:tRNA 2-thiouridine synthesizing protein E